MEQGRGREVYSRRLPVVADAQALRRGWRRGGRTTATAAQEPVAVSEPAPRRSTTRRTALVCGLAALCLLISLIPALREAVRAGTADGMTIAGLRDTLCRALVSAGLPPTDSPLFGWGELVQGDRESESESESETDPATAEETATDDLSETAPETSPAAATETPTTETARAEETTDTHPVEDEESTSAAVTEPEGSDTAEIAIDPAEPEPDDTTVRQDMSEYRRGALYVWNESAQSLPTVPDAWTPVGDAEPLVLLVCSHPYEAYADPTDGVVADLALSLAEALRARGVSVICIRPEQLGLTSDSSVRECYTRTEAAVRYYCRLYERVSLVLDIRRSAETVDGAPLAAVGWVEDAPVAQVRFIVDQLRETAPTGAHSDLSLALTLRQGLFSRSPALSRPVYVRATQGLLSEAPGVPLADGTLVPTFLTVELGSSGNTFAEASRAVDFLGEALGAVCGGG